MASRFGPLLQEPSRFPLEILQSGLERSDKRNENQGLRPFTRRQPAASGASKPIAG
jgi:hypothetical protein